MQDKFSPATAPARRKSCFWSTLIYLKRKQKTKQCGFQSFSRRPRLISEEKNHHVYRCCCARDEGSFGVHCVAGGGLVRVFAEPFHCPELQERWGRWKYLTTCRKKKKKLNTTRNDTRERTPTWGLRRHSRKWRHTCHLRLSKQEHNKPTVSSAENRRIPLLNVVNLGHPNLGTR